MKLYNDQEAVDLSIEAIKRRFWELWKDSDLIWSKTCPIGQVYSRAKLLIIIPIKVKNPHIAYSTTKRIQSVVSHLIASIIDGFPLPRMS